MSRVNTGYTGILEGPEGLIRCTDFNVIRQQEVLFYDHVIGLVDTIPSGIETKGEDTTINIQKTIERPGVKLVSGGLAFPVTEENSSAFFEEVKRGQWFDFTFDYSCGDGAFQFRDCRVNSYTFSATAGDIATVSVDIMGKDYKALSYLGNYQDAQKLMTWDKIKIEGVPGNNGIVSFTFTVNNNLMPIYTAKENKDKSLKPFDIRVGMQSVTGSVTVYKNNDEFEFDLSQPVQLKLTVPGFTTPINVVFKPSQPFFQ